MAEKYTKGYVVQQKTRGGWAFFAGQTVHKTKRMAEKKIKRLKKGYPYLKFRVKKVAYLKVMKRKK